MAQDALVHLNALDVLALNETVGAAGTSVSTSNIVIPKGAQYIIAQGKFTYGSGGTTAKYYLQTSLDGGTTWCDIMCFAFATATARTVQAVITTTALAAGVTPTDGSLADNTILSGLIGPIFRVKRIIAGTYVTTTVRLDITFKG
jgi:hypothetical protein